MASKLASVWYREIYHTLLPVIKNPRETDAITKKLLASHLNYSALHHLMDTLLDADTATEQVLYDDLKRLCAQEPIQYVLGRTDFCGHTFVVTPDVLIPRPTTEELTQYILDNHPSIPKQVLDLCTGSGCIAISLAKAWPEATVTAMDISLAALAIARQNAKQLGVHLQLQQLDLLKEEPPPKQWEVIVSNPPYVPISEKKHMQPNVLDYEPPRALFVPNEEPLIFYERIASLAHRHLTPQGMLYVEIHEAFGLAISELFAGYGLQKIGVHSDIDGKARWIVAEKC